MRHNQIKQGNVNEKERSDLRDNKKADSIDLMNTTQETNDSPDVQATGWWCHSL